MRSGSDCGQSIETSVANWVQDTFDLVTPSQRNDRFRSTMALVLPAHNAAARKVQEQQTLDTLKTRMDHVKRMWEYTNVGTIRSAWRGDYDFCKINKKFVPGSEIVRVDGRLMWKKHYDLAQTNAWLIAVRRARIELGLDGHPRNMYKGSALHTRAKELLPEIKKELAQDVAFDAPAANN